MIVLEFEMSKSASSWSLLGGLLLQSQDPDRNTASMCELPWSRQT